MLAVCFIVVDEAMIVVLIMPLVEAVDCETVTLAGLWVDTTIEVVGRTAMV